MLELLHHLWPDFGLIRTPGLQTMELGVWFWILMVFITLLSAGFVLYHRFRCGQRVGYIKKLIAGEDRNSLAQNKKSTQDKALAQDKQTGSLWREFDESLVYSADKQTLSNTLDAEHFFNSNTLAYGLTSSRLLSAAPTFLTAIGVLGTFVGLTIGLKDLQVNADEIATLKAGVSSMINGAAVAFMTSVWGVGLSLFLNMFEKLIERGALTKIRQLQQEIDFLYPRIPAEQSLVHIAESTHESKTALQELHERIGDRLQETVSGMSDSMQQAFTNALNNVMAPAIQTLVDNASQQSTDVLEKLVTNFMDGMKSAGTEQGQLMQAAAGNVSNAVSTMATRMDELFMTLSEQQHQNREQTENSSRDFAEQLLRQRTEADQRQQEMEQRFNALMQQLSEKLAGQFDAVDQRDQARQQAFGSLLNETTDKQTSILESQIKSAEERDQRRSDEFRHLQQTLAAQTQQANLSFDEQSRRQREEAEQRQHDMEQRFNALMQQLSEKLAGQFDAVDQRDQARQQAFGSLLGETTDKQTSILESQIKSAEERDQRRADEFRQLQQTLTAQTQQANQSFDEQITRQREEAEQRQAEMERRFIALMEQMTRHVGGQFEAAELRDKARTDELARSQREVADSQSAALNQFSHASAEQIKAMQEAANAQQGMLGDAFKSTLQSLHQLISDQTQSADKREAEAQQRFRAQLEQLIAEQQQLMKTVTDGVHQTQQQMLQTGEQHKQLLAQLNTATSAAQRSSEHMSNSSAQLGMLSMNLKQATEVLDIRLKAVTDSLEGAAEQNQTLATQITRQAGTLSELQIALSDTTRHFEAAAQSAEHGFKELDKHQAEFLKGIHQEFTNLGATLTKQVEGIEQQADEWLRSYSNEVRTQVSERMEHWNETTLQFADQMRRTVSAISGIVDDLERNGNALV